MEFFIDGILVQSNLADLSQTEARKYIGYVLQNVKHTDSDVLDWIDIKFCDDGKIDLNYQFHGEPFERIRRITGYLTGHLGTWNNAKRAEESDRVKHGINDFAK